MAERLPDQAKIRELKIELAAAEAAGDVKRVGKLRTVIDDERGVTEAAEKRAASGASKSSTPAGRSAVPQSKA